VVEGADAGWLMSCCETIERLPLEPHGDATEAYAWMGGNARCQRPADSENSLALPKAPAVELVNHFGLKRPGFEMRGLTGASLDVRPDETLAPVVLVLADAERSGEVRLDAMGRARGRQKVSVQLLASFGAQDVQHQECVLVQR